VTPLSTVARSEWSRQLGRALVDAGLLDEELAGRLVDEAVRSDTPLSALVIGRQLASSAAVVTSLAQLARLPAVDLRVDRPLPEMRDVLPRQLSADYNAVAVRTSGGQVVVAFAEPPDPEDVRSIAQGIGHPVVPALGDPLVVVSLVHAGDGAAAAAAPPPPPAPPARGAPVEAPPSAQRESPNGQGRHGEVEPPMPPMPPMPPRAPAGGPGAVPAGGARGTALHVDDLLRYAVGIGASDLHLTVNMPPTLRVNGALRPLEDVSKLDNDTLREMIYGILTQSQREQFEEEHEIDTSHSIAGVGRFRVNVCLQRGTVAVALRPIPHDIPEFASLGIPESVAGFASLRRGLVLVTGPTGSGKSTTLASLVDIINRNRPLHIVTVEDPIEFLHSHKRSVISQREVGADTLSFAEALRRALRQDPDVILVGEMRDLETIATALTASETGHLVFGTLHTQDAPSTVDRIIDVFPPNQQDQIRIQLGSSLAGVVTQQLVPTTDGRGRAVATEILVCTPAIQNLIRGAKTHQIYSLMQTGAQHGMQTMDQSLALLVKQGKVSEAVALDRCKNQEDFRNHLVSG
jgi:twitching motility protein PilT